MYSKVLLLLIFLGLFMAACGEKDTAAVDSGKLKIVATTGMISDMVREIGGERVNVQGLMGPGVDPHLYKVSQGDIRKMSEAEMIFYNGLHLEGKMVDILEKIGRNKTVVAISSDISEDKLRRPVEFEGAPDPHIWFDIALWRNTIPSVLKSLSVEDPEGKALFEKNAAQYSAKLDSLHLWVSSQIEKIPESQRVLVTAHDAFGYFGIAYNIEVMGLQGISTLSEFGVLDISRMLNMIVEKRLRSIFVESSVPEKSILAVRQGCAEKGWEVANGGTLYSDALGGPGSGAETYIGMVRTNVNTIVNALK